VGKNVQSIISKTGRICKRNTAASDELINSSARTIPITYVNKKRQDLACLTKFYSYFCFVGTQTHTKQWEETDILTSVEEPCNLIVWNDEVNTFQWVIETLMEICGHSYEQAEQCSYIIHFQGKYAVKKGIYDELKPMCDAITDRGIGATVEMVVE
jgi:ATP-dependent Clp protease adaptor protein ClpS